MTAVEDTPGAGQDTTSIAGPTGWQGVAAIAVVALTVAVLLLAEAGLPLRWIAGLGVVAAASVAAIAKGAAE